MGDFKMTKEKEINLLILFTAGHSLKCFTDTNLFNLLNNQRSYDLFFTLVRVGFAGNQTRDLEHVWQELYH